MHSASEYVPQSLVNARKRYTSLQDLIGQLSIKVSDVAFNSESEFLAAYRVHMLSIQSELKDLNEQVAKAEEQLNDDGHVAKLEHEVTWFKDESLRLKTNAESMSQDFESMVVKLQALNEQKKFLSDQLKSVMKRSRVLESELEYNGNENDNSINESLGEFPGAVGYADEPTFEQPNKPTKSDLSLGLQSIENSSAGRRIPKEKKKKTFNSSQEMSLVEFKDSLLPPLPHTKPKPITYTDALQETLQSRKQAELDLEFSIKSVLEIIVSRRIHATAQSSLR